MPLILTPSHQSQSPVLRDAVKQHLITYSAYVLANDTYISPGTPGYLAYNKRQAFAVKAIANPDAYVDQATTLISNMDAQLMSVTLPNYGTPDLFFFIDSQNPAGRHLFECLAINGYNHVGLGNQGNVYNALAGISQADYI